MLFPCFLSRGPANILPQRCRQDPIPAPPPPLRPIALTDRSLQVRPLHLHRISSIHPAPSSNALLASSAPRPPRSRQALSLAHPQHPDARSRVSRAYPPVSSPRGNREAQRRSPSYRLHHRQFPSRIRSISWEALNWEQQQQKWQPCRSSIDAANGAAAITGHTPPRPGTKVQPRSRGLQPSRRSFPPRTEHICTLPSSWHTRRATTSPKQPSCSFP